MEKEEDFNFEDVGDDEDAAWRLAEDMGAYHHLLLDNVDHENYATTQRNIRIYDENYNAMDEIPLEEAMQHVTFSFVPIPPFIYSIPNAIEIKTFRLLLNRLYNSHFIPRIPREIRFMIESYLYDEWTNCKRSEYAYCANLTILSESKLCEACRKNTGRYTALGFPRTDPYSYGLVTAHEAFLRVHLLVAEDKKKEKKKKKKKPQPQHYTKHGKPPINKNKNKRY